MHKNEHKDYSNKVYFLLLFHYSFHSIHLQRSLETFQSYEMLYIILDRSSKPVVHLLSRPSSQRIWKWILWKAPAGAELCWCPAEPKQQPAEWSNFGVSRWDWVALPHRAEGFTIPVLPKQHKYQTVSCCIHQHIQIIATHWQQSFT